MKAYTCNSCGTRFERNTRGNHKFCDSCKSSARKTQYECHHCGDHFEGQKPAEQGGRKYCSADCKYTAEKTRSCERCHKQYIPEQEYKGYRGIVGAAVCKDCKEKVKNTHAKALFKTCELIAEQIDEDASDVAWSVQQELKFFASDIRNHTRAFTVNLELYSYKAIHAAKHERTGDHINGMTNIAAVLIDHIRSGKITESQQVRNYLDQKTPTIQVCKDENSVDLKTIQTGHLAFSPEMYYDACGGIYYFDHNDQPTKMTKQEFVDLCGDHFLVA